MLIGNGVALDLRERLLAAAAHEYPANKVFGPTADPGQEQADDFVDVQTHHTPGSVNTVDRAPSDTAESPDETEPNPTSSRHRKRVGWRLHVIWVLILSIAGAAGATYFAAEHEVATWFMAGNARKELVTRLSGSGVDLVECGPRKDVEKQFGLPVAIGCNPSEMELVIATVSTRDQSAAFMHWHASNVSSYGDCGTARDAVLTLSDERLKIIGVMVCSALSGKRYRVSWTLCGSGLVAMLDGADPGNLFSWAYHHVDLRRYGALRRGELRAFTNSRDPAATDRIFDFSGCSDAPLLDGDDLKERLTWPAGDSQPSLPATAG
ncbi:hypothetical protein BCD49_30115 [Pseudofrankia sp. EUN1h]|nr:hypothetical protein BCD49_30115 [Pseudofrankia sp. EUN1h]